MEDSSGRSMSPHFSVMVMSGTLTFGLASLLAYIMMKRSDRTSSSSNSSNSNSSNGAATNSTKADKAASSSAATAATTVLDRSQYPGGELTVYYATQTGTAESFARTLEREGPEHGFLVHVVDLEDVQVEDLHKRKDEISGTSRVIVLAATYGEGEAPDNATVFVQSLCEKASTEILYEKSPESETVAEPSLLKGVEYCVFGLGNRQYDHFNAMGKFFDHAFERIGATRILELGNGDDDDDLENDFDTWKDTKLWPTLSQKYVGDAKLTQQASSGGTASLPECQYVIQYHPPDTKPAPLTGHEIHSQSRHYFTAVDCPVTAVRELRTNDVDSTVHIEIDIGQGEGLTYQTADNLAVLPMNETSVVESVAKSLSYDLDQIFSLTAAPNHDWHGAPFPMPISVRECLTRYCDLTNAPRRSELKQLAAYAKNATDQKALLRMASKEGRVEYREKILDGLVGLVDILKLCPSIQMPLEHFLGICPLLQSRFFTISSSSSVHPQTVHLTVAVTKTTRKDGTVFKGVCSNYLASRRPGLDTIRVYCRPSTFRLPQDASRPILMIGPGTGVAPMRALLQERRYQRQQSQPQHVGKNILYFGCKKESQDFLYREEWEVFQQENVLNKLRLAFSRDHPDRKVYVQHLLLEDGDDNWKLINEEGAYIYVCGGVKMGQDVAETLNQIIVAHGNMTHDQAKQYLDKMSSEGRYVQELWA